jgi:TRAP-type mannitol/chloroaromatic compound transport system permease small subunit
MNAQKHHTQASSVSPQDRGDSPAPRYAGIPGLNQLVQASGSLAACLSVYLVIITCVIAGARYGFNVTSAAWQESGLYAHAALIMFGSAFAMRENAQVRVDIFYRGWSMKRKAWIDAIGTLIFLLPTCVFLWVMSWDYVALSWSMKERSTEGDGLAYLYIMKSLLLIGPVLLAIQGMQILIGSFRIIKTGRIEHD